MPHASQDFLQDHRRSYHFWIDDDVIDLYGSRIGAYGIAVYALLARHAKHAQSFPSYKRMSRQLGISRQTISRTLEKLAAEGLITKEKRHAADGDLDTNLYTIHHISHELPDVSCEDRGRSSGDVGVGPLGTDGRSSGDGPLPMKDPHLKDSQIEGLEIPSVSCEETSPPREKTKWAYRCPEGFLPDVTTRQWAENKFPQVNFEDALEAMRDCEFKNHHCDWNATLRTWIRREAEKPPVRHTEGRSKEEQRIARTMAASRELAQEIEREIQHGSRGLSPFLSRS